jgi:hypothetical protein
MGTRRRKAELGLTCRPKCWLVFQEISMKDRWLASEIDFRLVQGTLPQSVKVWRSPDPSDGLFQLIRSSMKSTTSWRVEIAPAALFLMTVDLVIESPFEQT